MCMDQSGVYYNMYLLQLGAMKKAKSTIQNLEKLSIYICNRQVRSQVFGWLCRHIHNITFFSHFMGGPHYRPRKLQFIIRIQIYRYCKLTYGWLTLPQLSLFAAYVWINTLIGIIGVWTLCQYYYRLLLNYAFLISFCYLAMRNLWSQDEKIFAPRNDSFFK